MRRRDDPRYVKSAIATVAFYAAVLAACAAAGFFLRGWALAGLAALVLWLYRGPLFGAARWPAPLVEDEIFQTGLVDYIVYGEGEHTMLELCLALEAGKDPHAIRNLAWRAADGRTVRNPKLGFDGDLDDLPWPARHLVDMRKYQTFR